MPLTGPGLQSIDKQNELAVFANGVSQATGIDPRVIIAQAQQEGAYAPGGTGGHNYLNLASATVDSLGAKRSGSSAGGFAQFNNVQDAISATVAEFKSPAIGLTSEAGKTPATQIADIAATPWDTGHYGGNGGVNLLRTFDSIYGAPAAGKPAPSDFRVSGTPGSGGTGVTGSDSTFQAVTKPFKSIEEVFTFLTSWRFAEVVGGFALLVVGLVLLGKQFGISPPAAVPVPV